MTSPSKGGASKIAPPAPNGVLQSGAPAPDVDSARDDMINVFLQRTTDLDANEGYYNATQRPEAVGVAVPQEMRSLLAYVGYPRLYVDSLSDRLEIEGFRLGIPPDVAAGASASPSGASTGAPTAQPNPATGAPPSAPAAPGTSPAAGKGAPGSPDAQLWDWWQANDLDVEAPLGHNEAFVNGRSYITVAAPDPAIDLDVDPTVPIIRVESAKTLYAVIDPRTRAVTQALRYIVGADGTPQAGQVVAATLYLPLSTTAWIKDPQSGQWTVVQQVPHNLGIVPVVPLTNKTLLSDLYGTSEITPELRSITDAAARILMNLQSAAELMGVPQRILFGVKPQEIGVDPATGQSRYDAYMARILAFEEQSGSASQFQASELRNFCDALDQLDRKAAAYTGLPPQYISYSSANPASAEAIEASESRLVKKAERKAVVFGGAWEQAMRIAIRVMGTAQLPPEYYRMETIWRDPSTPTYASQAAAAVGLYAGGAGVIPKKRARRDMGYSIVEIDEMEQWDIEEMQGLMGAYTGGPLGGPGTQPPSPNTAHQVINQQNTQATIDQNAQQTSNSNSSKS